MLCLRKSRSTKGNRNSTNHKRRAFGNSVDLVLRFSRRAQRDENLLRSFRGGTYNEQRNQRTPRQRPRAA